ncbi:unnamed protein product [Effrenium voratum]|uniref:Uncharacterized protein n=1 Tax=Effrenium voratum TaxID=2562239 RepID=A0AA36NAQ1_9DINO|nr:unnamed protein product [Effrenium voratum]
MGCKRPAGSDDAVHMLKLWVAVSNMRQGKMVLRLAAWLHFNQTAVAVLLGWSRSFGGRGSMATQHTDKELAPHKAAGKVLVPLGREMPLGDQQAWVQELTAKLFAEVWILSTGHLQQQSYAMSVFATPTERGSLS